MSYDKDDYKNYGFDLCTGKKAIPSVTKNFDYPIIFKKIFSFSFQPNLLIEISIGTYNALRRSEFIMQKCTSCIYAS